MPQPITDIQQHLVTLLGDNLSKNFTVMMAQEVSSNPEWLAVLTDIMLSEHTPYNWRAAWVIDHVQQNTPEVIAPILPRLIAALPHITSNGVRRHILKMASTLPVDQLEDGELADICFKWLQNPATPIANRAHCMEILYRLTCRYHDLANELALILEEIIINGSKGEKNKAQKTLQKITPWRR